MYYMYALCDGSRLSIQSPYLGSQNQRDSGCEMVRTQEQWIKGLFIFHFQLSQNGSDYFNFVIIHFNVERGSVSGHHTNKGIWPVRGGNLRVTTLQDCFPLSKREEVSWETTQWTEGMQYRRKIPRLLLQVHPSSSSQTAQPPRTRWHLQPAFFRLRIRNITI